LSQYDKDNIVYTIYNKLIKTRHGVKSKPKRENKMNTLNQIQADVAASVNAAAIAAGYDNQWLIETFEANADDCMAAWLSANPMPHGNGDDFQFCVDKAMWSLENGEACRFFNGDELTIHVPAYRWNIEQAIINRNSGTMLSAALSYVDGLLA